MATAIQRQTHSVRPKPIPGGQLTDFLRELSELSYRQGIAIGGKPELYMMERPDFDHAYQCAEDGALTLG